MLINKLIVIGFGLIGASVAGGLKKAGQCAEVIAIAQSKRTRERALELGLADRSCAGLDELSDPVGVDDLICIAVPTLAVPSVLAQINDKITSDVTLTDCTSVKGSIRDAAIQVFGRVPPHFILGHPIAGSERSGVDAADADLFQQHRTILTPLEDTDPEHYQRVCDLWNALGAEVLSMPVDEHDEVLAATSHLPHVIAYSLVDTLAHDAENENIFRYAAGGFRDFTRIASSDPIMWHDIMQSNRDNIVKAIDLFSQNLDKLREAIAEGDSDKLMGVFTRAKAARDYFVSRLQRRPFSSGVVDSMQSSSVSYVVNAGGRVSGVIRVPGDKSISHRAIMLGSIAEGLTDIQGLLEGEDALATLQAFRDMGVVVEGPNNGQVRIHGVGLHGLKAPPGPLYLGNSGTAMRLLSGLLAGQSFSTSLTGDESLSKRPMNRVIQPLTAMGAEVASEAEGRPPLKISGGRALNGINYDLPMASAQVKSCVLLAGLYARGKTTVTEPAITRDHTERMLQGFGYDVRRDGSTVSLQGGGKLCATKIEVPADISSAAFFMVAAAIAPDSDLTLTHVGVNPTRIGVINILKLMGADIDFSNEKTVGGEPVADIRVRYAPLQGIDVPADQVPLAIDEFPILFIAAACAQGTTTLTGAEELRVKESDRIQVMADGLQTLGVNAVATADGMIIEGGTINGGHVDSHGDHRIAMSFAVAALRARDTITIDDCANVATSFPGFAALAGKAGIRIEQKTS